MGIWKGRPDLRKINSRYAYYPIAEIAVAVALLYLSPFVSPLLVFGTFAICLYRIVMYDAKVFAVDYVILIPISSLFRYQGMSLLIFLCLIAAVWYFFTDELTKEPAYAVLLVLMNYLLWRMSWNISGMVLCFGQLAFLCVMLPKQDRASANTAVKLFCISLLVSSAYGLLLRNTSQIYAVRGPESPALWGTALTRFQGLFADPNYYMVMLITAMALLLKLLDCGMIKRVYVLLLGACFCYFGLLTYSKTFFLSLLVMALLGIFWLFKNRKYLPGVALLVGGSLLLWFLAETNDTVSVILLRITSATSLDELTTGRSELLVDYYNAITQNLKTTLFGVGLAAQNLGKDPHNLYLEIAYRLGVVGLVLFVCLCVALIYSIKQKNKGRKNHWLSKYIVLIMVLMLHLSLHGIFMIFLYAVFFLAFLSILLTKQET